MMVPCSRREERMVNPARVSSDGRVWSAELMLRRCRVPRGVRPVKSWGRKTEILGRRVWYSDSESVM